MARGGVPRGLPRNRDRMMRAKDIPAGEPDEHGADARFLARVRALLPEIAASADAIEQTQRIPEPLLRKLVDAEMFRLFLPRSVGGREGHPLTYMRMAEAVAKIDASTAWNLGQNNVCGIVAAYLAPEIARAIFADPRAILAWGPPEGPTRAIACEGGYRVSGRWFFASGGRHATWLGAYCPVYEADGTPRLGAAGQPAKRVFLFPAQAATWFDVWNVIGLRGTASDTFAVTDLFVPEGYSVIRDDNVENHEAGWLYCFTSRSLYPCGFASVALGVARTMLDEFVTLARQKTPRGFASPLGQNAAIQSGLGRAEAALSSSRTHLFQTMSETCEAVRRDHRVSLDQRMAIRLAATHAIHQARLAGEFAYEAAGASAIFAANPFERRFRDLHTVAQQVQGRASHFETVGQFLLGLETDHTFV